MADDVELHEQINALVAEEHELRAGPASAESRDRLTHLQRQLDQAWDLLRRRQAARESGGDPTDVTAQPESTVEGYLQ
jgi:hypothetical protein